MDDRLSRLDTQLDRDGQTDILRRNIYDTALLHSIAQVTRKLCYRKDDARDARYISGSNEPLRRYGHSRILGHMEPPFFGGEEEVVGGQRWSDGTIRKSDGGFL